MKRSKSPVWQKKRKRKFKNTKHIQEAAAARKAGHTTLKQPASPKQENQPKKPSFFHTLFHKQKRKVQEKEHKPSHGRTFLKGWLKRHDSDIQLTLFPLILLSIVCILYVINAQFSLALSRQEPLADSQQSNLQPYPYVEAISTPVLSGEAAIILDRGSQVVLFSKNPQLRFSIASTTKIMTALIALSYYKPHDILTVKRSYVPGSGLNLYAGEQFHFTDLLYAMLLPSANDAAQTIADNYPGGESAFVAKMNEKAQSLHLTNTHYSDPIGLDDDGDYSTVIDMARLASYASLNTMFDEVTSTKYKTIYTSNYGRQYPLTNTNELLGIDGVTGIKTGTTEGAKEVLVTSVVKNNHTYIIVVMDSTDRFGDTEKLLHFIDTNVKYIVPPGPAM